MIDKIVLLLGDIAHEGLTSELATSGHSYKRKLLSSSVQNWESILDLFQTHDVRMVLGKLSGDVYRQLVSDEYGDVGFELLKEIARRPHRLFAYEALLANKESVEEEEFEGFWRPSIAVMQQVNELLRTIGIDVLPYQKRAEVTVSAQSFVKETNDGLIFRLYVPSGRLWGDQMGQLLSLFKDYLSKVAGLNVRLDQQSTSKGVIYAFHGSDIAPGDREYACLTKHFEDFTKLTDLCVTNPAAAEGILKGSRANAHEITQIISRYSKEFKRLQIDLKHAREDKILSIRHRLESELVDMVENDQHVIIQTVVNALVPDVIGTGINPLLMSGPVPSAAPNITLNFKPQFVEHVQGIVAQEVSGNTCFNASDKQLILLFESYGKGKAADLISALQELNDESAPESGRVTAKQRIKQFLIAAAGKIGDATVGILQSYVEKKFLGL